MPLLTPLGSCRALLASLLILSSCQIFGPLDNPRDQTGGNPSTPVTSVQLNKAGTTVLIHGKEQLVAQVSPPAASDPRVVWSSEYPDRVSVDQTGGIEGLALGTSRITATTRDGAKVAWCDVTVSPTPKAVTGVTLDRVAVTLSLVPGHNTVTLVPGVSPIDATNQNVEWKSSKPLLVTVDSTGLVTALADTGSLSVTITASAADKDGASATCVVTVDTVSPGPVTDLTATAGNAQVLLSWSKPVEPDFSGIEITWTPSGGTLAQPLTVDKTVANKVISGLTIGTNYAFTLKSMDAVGNKSPSVTVSKTPVTETPLFWSTLGVPGMNSKMLVTSLSASEDGSKLAVATGDSYHPFYSSSDGGVTWSEQNNLVPKFVCTSADGATLYSAVSGGTVYRSLDQGKTWVAKAGSGSRAWSSLSCSADGTRLAATVTSGFVYLSSDSGVTWSEISTFGTDFTRMSISSNGQVLVGYRINKGVWISPDFGSTWTEQTYLGNRQWYGAALSADGSRIIVCNLGGNCYLSSDTGATWAPLSTLGAKSWATVGVSPDGKTLYAAYNAALDRHFLASTDDGATWKDDLRAGSLGEMVVAGNTGIVYSVPTISGTSMAHYVGKSVDSGQTWQDLGTLGTRVWKGVAMSHDGKKIVASVYNGYVYTSTDGGTQWTEHAELGTNTWGKVSVSADGSRVALVDADNGYVYTSVNSGLDWTKQVESGVGNWETLCMSDDGLVLMVASSYVPSRTAILSTDGGTTWNPVTAVGAIASPGVACSPDGSSLWILGASVLYQSTDKGSHWTPITLSTALNAIGPRSSSDGSVLFANSRWNRWISHNGGTTWSSIGNSSSVDNDVALVQSTDGNSLIYGGWSYSPVRSTDQGLTWGTPATLIPGGRMAGTALPDCSRVIIARDGSRDLFVGQ